jgi:capsular polysaccharide biosynthesis protein
LEEVEIDLMEYINIIKRRLWIVITLPLVFVIVSALVTEFYLPEIFEADSTVYVISNRSGLQENINFSTNHSDVMSDLRLSDILANDYRELIQRRVVLDEVIDSLGYQESITPNQLSSMISVDLKRNTRIMQIKVKNKDPQLAAILADRVTQVLSEIVSEKFELENITIIDDAVVPTRPVSPRLRLNVAIAFVLGLMIALGLAFLLEYLDNTLKTGDDVEKYLKLPVLAVVPVVEENEKGDKNESKRKK